MVAQIGSNAQLAYGNQGAQQAGGAVLLSYDPIITSDALMVGRMVRAPWVKSRGSMRPLDSSYVATSIEDTDARAPWAAAKDERLATDSPWKAAARKDDDRLAAWGEFGEMSRGDRRSGWAKSVAQDDTRRTAWVAYGGMLNEDRGGVWIGSRAEEAMRLGVMGAYLIKTYAPVPYARPLGNAASFFTVGGSPIPVQLPGTSANLRLPLAVQFGATGYSAHFLGDPLRQYTLPVAHASGFRVGRETALQLLVDESGNPILSPSARDSVKLNPWGAGRRIDKGQFSPWTKYSRPMNPGWGIVVPGGPPPLAPGESLVIPVRRFYIVVNEVLLARVDDNSPIHATALSVNFDCDSWLPTFSATIPESARDAVMPDPSPVEVYAYINGAEFRFFVEKVSRTRQFGQNAVAISGRGVACELDAPFAVASQHTNGSSMTAQQLIDAALTPTGYTQTWNITDWLVPAGTFSLFGTPAEVAGAVAEASGSVLQADWLERDLRMLPRYPVKPWDWAAATPDIIIPGAVVQTESVEWVEKPDYNVVYVSGTTAGVIGQVKITGTAGDKPAPMFTHPLITHNDAARQKGIATLSDTGRKTMMQLSLPVLPESGVIDVCKLIEFNDGTTTRRGIVRANSVSVNMPTVRQTLTIEAAA